jgi:hypothetical protein
MVATNSVDTYKEAKQNLRFVVDQIAYRTRNSSDTAIRIIETIDNFAKGMDSDRDEIVPRRRSSTSSEPNNVTEINGSTSSLNSNTELVPKPKKRFFSEELTKRKVISVGIMFLLNLINYLDRFTVAG